MFKNERSGEWFILAEMVCFMPPTVREGDGNNGGGGDRIDGKTPLGVAIQG